MAAELDSPDVHTEINQRKSIRQTPLLKKQHAIMSTCAHGRGWLRPLMLLYLTASTAEPFRSPPPQAAATAAAPAAGGGASSSSSPSVSSPPPPPLWLLLALLLALSLLLPLTPPPPSTPTRCRGCEWRRKSGGAFSTPYSERLFSIRLSRCQQQPYHHKEQNNKHESHPNHGRTVKKHVSAP